MHRHYEALAETKVRCLRVIQIENKGFSRCVPLATPCVLTSEPLTQWAKATLLLEMLTNFELDCFTIVRNDSAFLSFASASLWERALPKAHKVSEVIYLAPAFLNTSSISSVSAKSKAV